MDSLPRYLRKLGLCAGKLGAGASCRSPIRDGPTWQTAIRVRLPLFTELQVFNWNQNHLNHRTKWVSHISKRVAQMTPIILPAAPDLHRAMFC
jgi:hypothetical protein